MIRLIDIEIILARRREGRQEQANRRRRRRRKVWTREWLQRRVMFGQYDTLPWWPFLYSRWGFFWGPSSSLEALCSKYSVVSRWQQVVVFSVVFECCMIIHELCTDVETVSGRTWPCIIRTGTLLVVWRSYETVLVVWRSYKTVCTVVWIVWWSCDIRVLIRVLDVGLGKGFTLFHTIYIRYWHGWAHSWSGLHVRLYIQSRTVSHGLVPSLIRKYTDMAPVPVF